MKNTSDWYLTDRFVCIRVPQVLERVTESPFITFQPKADRSTPGFQIHAANCKKYGCKDAYRLHLAQNRG